MQEYLVEYFSVMYETVSYIGTELMKQGRAKDSLAVIKAFDVETDKINNFKTLDEIGEATSNAFFAIGKAISDIDTKYGTVFAKMHEVALRELRNKIVSNVG